MSFSEPFVWGLPWTAWLLCIAPIGLGLGIELLFYLRHRWRRD